jgi:DUF1365 family protein
MTCLDHIKAHTYHGRKGPVSNAFRYAIDYVLIDLAADLHLPRLFSRNRFNLMSLFDSDHGGAPKRRARLGLGARCLNGAKSTGPRAYFTFGATKGARSCV